MTRARVFALLSFIAIGAAGGSLILGESVWFAWSAVLGAIALVIWGRTHDQPAPPPPPEPDRPVWAHPVWLPAGDADAPPWPLPCPVFMRHELKPIWPLPTNHFGAPE